MKLFWFRSWGWLYRPVHPFGWVVTLLALLFCVHVAIVIDQHSLSVTDTLYGVFPYIVPTFLVWLWVASKSAR